jgi:hypothetical protein
LDVDTPYSAPAPTPADNVHQPRLVVGDRGAAWLMEGWDRFKAAYGQWLALTLVGCLVLVVINYVPFLNLINSLLSPVWIGGLMLACQAQHEGKPVTVDHLFAGFRHHTSSLLLCGLVVLLLNLVVVVPLLGSFLYQLLTAPDPQSVLLDLDLNSLLIRVLLVLALTLPMVAASWFAPALIVLGNKSVKEALLLSMRGCLKNSWPFLIYGLVGILLCLLIPLTLGLAALVLAPVFFSSIYLGYRDIFID